jgi:phosphoribosylaminoimidazole carboxylase PurK protein
MLTTPAKQLGFDVKVVDPVPNCPAAQVGAEQILAGLKDTNAIDILAQQSDVLTWEIEHIPADYLVDLVSRGHDVQPSPETLLMIQDKLAQKQFLQSRGIQVAPFSDKLDGSQFLGGGPFIVKTRTGGYDGRGNLVVKSLNPPPDIKAHFGDQPVYVEQAVNFEKELAVIAARDRAGNISVYPPVETIHRDNICHMVLAPAEISPRALKSAEDIAATTLKELHGAGVFAIEMFVVDDDVLVNEIAPRVHNSGHLTTEANVTSQFEQHVRAITGLTLGSVAMRAPAAAMINILGQREEPLCRAGLDRVLATPDTHPHFYGKSSRAARKIGHITVLGSSIDEVKSQAEAARKELSI